MALAKLITVLAIAVVVCAFAAAPTATAYAGAVEPPESCQTQIVYFTNCLARDELDREKCCNVVANKRCFCQLKREVAVPCHPHRHHHGQPCPGHGAPAVTLSELQKLSCFKGLKCY